MINPESNGSFSPEAAEKIGLYVYRLIDPRNGHTFYVGKGKGNRVFQHCRNALQVETLQEEEKEYVQSKNKRIVDIIASGMNVLHVIHRHGLSSEKIAYEVEAALIEAYEGLENVTGGYDNSERGCAHANELIRKYTAPVIQPKHDLIAFSCGRSIRDLGSIYDACRFAWILNRKKLGIDFNGKDKSPNKSRYKYALAVDRGYVLDVFRISAWLKATPSNFPGLSFSVDAKLIEDFSEKRTGFVSEEPTPDEVLKMYKHRRIENPTQNPVRYISSEAPSDS